MTDIMGKDKYNYISHKNWQMKYKKYNQKNTREIQKIHSQTIKKIRENRPSKIPICLKIHEKIHTTTNSLTPSLPRTSDIIRATQGARAKVGLAPRQK